MKTGKKKICFVTTNKHKFLQAKRAFGLLCPGITLIHKNLEYDEPKEKSMKEIALGASQQLANKLRMPVFVDDTGLELSAYPGFPGAQPKFVFDRIGYDGIFRLLAGKSRNAEFISAIGYCEPGKKPKVFVGTCKGKITEKVYCEDKLLLPYERIFVSDGQPKGREKVMGMMSEEEKEKISHRYKALNMLIKHLLL